MTQQKTSQPKFAVCVENKDYPVSLEVRKIYRIVPDAAAAKVHCLRVTDESGDDYLYPDTYFAPITLPVSVSRRLRALTFRRRPQKGGTAQDKSAAKTFR